MHFFRLSSLLLTTTVVVFLLPSCSSPEGKGEDLGQKYCDCISGTEKFSSPAEFRQRKDSCDALIAEDWKQAETGYMADSAQWTAFKSGFDAPVKPAMDVFQAGLQKANQSLAGKISSALRDRLWIRESRDEAWLVCSFSEGKLTTLSIAGSLGFTMNADTLLFEHKDKHKFLVRLEGEKLILCEQDGSRSTTFRPATGADQLIGTWAVSGGLTMELMQGGSCTIKEGWTTSSAKYVFAGGNLSIDGPPANPVQWNGNDAFSWGESQFTRIKSGRFSDPRFLLVRQSAPAQP